MFNRNISIPALFWVLVSFGFAGGFDFGNRASDDAGGTIAADASGYTANGGTLSTPDGPP